MTLSFNFEKKNNINREEKIYISTERCKYHGQWLKRLALDTESLCRHSQFQCHPPLGVRFFHPKCLVMKAQNGSVMWDVVLPQHPGSSVSPDWITWPKSRKDPSPSEASLHWSPLCCLHSTDPVCVKMHEDTGHSGQSSWEAVTQHSPLRIGIRSIHQATRVH